MKEVICRIPPFPPCFLFTKATILPLLSTVKFFWTENAERQAAAKWDNDESMPDIYVLARFAKSMTNVTSKLCTTGRSLWYDEKDPGIFSEVIEEEQS